MTEFGKLRIVYPEPPVPAPRLETREDAHVPNGPGDVRVMTLRSAHAAQNPLEYEQARAGALRSQQTSAVSRSKRTRWLTFANQRGAVVMAPGIRTVVFTLLIAMGREWYDVAMAVPDSATWTLDNDEREAMGLRVLV